MCYLANAPQRIFVPCFAQFRDVTPQCTSPKALTILRRAHFVRRLLLATLVFHDTLLCIAMLALHYLIIRGRFLVQRIGTHSLVMLCLGTRRRHGLSLCSF